MDTENTSIWQGFMLNNFLCYGIISNIVLIASVALNEFILICVISLSSKSAGLFALVGRENYSYYIYVSKVLNRPSII